MRAAQAVGDAERKRADALSLAAKCLEMENAELLRRWAAHVDNPDSGCIDVQPKDDAFLAAELPKFVDSMPTGARKWARMQQKVRAIDAKFDGDTTRSRKGLRWDPEVLNHLLAQCCARFA